LKTERKRTEISFIIFVSACLAGIGNENGNPRNEYEAAIAGDGYVTDTLRKQTFIEIVKYLGWYQWRTLTMNVGGAKRNYLEAEGANSKYFLFCMVKIINTKYYCAIFI
jgi:hypothetical protein